MRSRVFRVRFRVGYFSITAYLCPFTLHNSFTYNAFSGSLPQNPDSPQISLCFSQFAAPIVQRLSPSSLLSVPSAGERQRARGTSPHAPSSSLLPVLFSPPAPCSANPAVNHRRPPSTLCILITHALSAYENQSHYYCYPDILTLIPTPNSLIFQHLAIRQSLESSTTPIFAPLLGFQAHSSSRPRYPHSTSSSFHDTRPVLRAPGERQRARGRSPHAPAAIHLLLPHQHHLHPAPESPSLLPCSLTCHESTSSYLTPHQPQHPNTQIPRTIQANITQSTTSNQQPGD